MSIKTVMGLVATMSIPAMLIGRPDSAESDLAKACKANVREASEQLSIYESDNAKKGEFFDIYLSHPEAAKCAIAEMNQRQKKYELKAISTVDGTEIVQVKIINYNQK